MKQHAQLHSRNGEPVLFQGIRMAGRLQGALFEARVEQRFHNPTDRHLEVVYTFPLPYGAVLLDVSVKLVTAESGSAMVKARGPAAASSLMA